MTKEEILELIADMRAMGLDVELCDTPVPVSVAGVPCGSPAELGDQCIDDYVLVPKSVVGNHPEMLVPVIGDSMLDAGYEEGDKLRIRFGIKPRDGEDVLAVIDNAVTIKTLYTDEDGNKWLVPRNDKYDAICLTEDMDVKLLGVVVGVEKERIIASSRLLQQNVRRTKSRQRQASRLSEDKIDRILTQMGEEVKHARQWYAVFRAMVDYDVIAANAVPEFCERVNRLLPEHGHLPVAKELQRMAVQSFTKRVSMWREDNAPVSGSRYRDYQNIALMTGRLLGGE